MAKIDEIKEILNTFILVVLVGKLFAKFEKQELGTVFWIIFFVILLFIVMETKSL